MKVVKVANLSFPDKLAHGRDGSVKILTVQAMRAAKGDRRVAAKALGISTALLASRLSVIRKMQETLEADKP